MVHEISHVLGSRSALLAGAIGGVITLGDTLLGPVLAPVAELGAAAVTAWIGARLVCDLAHVNGVTKTTALKRASEATKGAHGNNLAHKTLDFACSAAAGDPKAVRAAGAIAVHCVRAQASSLVAHVLVGWSPPLFGSARVVSVSRAAFNAAAFVSALERSVTPEFAVAA